VPRTEVRFYKADDGAAPALEWMTNRRLVPPKAADKLFERIERLEALGHELRRPECDLLRDGVYELRVRHMRINYRLLYFFHKNVCAVLSHGLTKEAEVPAGEIDQAVRNMRRFAADPEGRSYKE
jgi:phage-related protein